MFNNKKCSYSSSASLGGDTFTVIGENFETENGTLEVTGAGEMRVTNTGGSGASEGGMGSDSDDDTAKGDITKPGGEKIAGTPGDEDEEDITFDPIKKNVREAEKKAGKD